MDGNEGVKVPESNGVEGPVTEEVVVVDPTDATRDSREQRIMDYMESSLRKPDALQATIGAVNSDLMLIGYRLKQAVHAAMNATPAALEEYSRLMPAVESLLKVSKQIDRFAQLEVRLRKAEQAPVNIPE